MAIAKWKHFFFVPICGFAIQPCRYCILFTNIKIFKICIGNDNTLFDAITRLTPFGSWRPARRPSLVSLDCGPEPLRSKTINVNYQSKMSRGEAGEVK
jgi:hypothetical protein